MRLINVAAAQMGPIQRSNSRQAVVPRMLALMDEAKARGADLIVYPELALTTFFPRWYMEDQTEVDFLAEQALLVLVFYFREVGIALIKAEGNDPIAHGDRIAAFAYRHRRLGRGNITGRQQ